MPIYEYSCKECGKKFEFLHRSDAKAVCPKCGSAKLQKEFSVFSAQAKSAQSSMCESGECGSEPGSCGGPEAGGCPGGGCGGMGGDF